MYRQRRYEEKQAQEGIIRACVMIPERDKENLHKYVANKRRKFRAEKNDPD